MKKISILFSNLLLFYFLLINANNFEVFAQNTSTFRFLAWGDTKSAVRILSELSDQAVLHNPIFTIYTGDLEELGFTEIGIEKWKRALN